MAESWWSVDFEAGQSYAPLQDAFAEALITRGGPRGAALFVQDHRGGRSTLLFTPGAVAIAQLVIQAHGGKPCATPEQASGYLVGDDRDKDIIPFGRMR